VLRITLTRKAEHTRLLEGVHAYPIAELDGLRDRHAIIVVFREENCVFEHRAASANDMGQTVVCLEAGEQVAHAEHKVSYSLICYSLFTNFIGY
jgi:hypothetical protein